LALSPQSPEAKLERLSRRAAWTLMWETVWPPLAWAGTVVLLFLAASWLGLWFVTPRPARLVGLILFALALAAALAPLLRSRWPSRSAILDRIDAAAPGLHRPAAGFEDSLANPSDDTTTRALWDLHRARLARRVEKLKVAPPSPGMAMRDPRALRFAALLLALAAGLSAGSERYARVAAAFEGPDSTSGAATARIDAWIDPPAYANKPPLLLKVVGQEKPEEVTTPEDSVLITRAAPGEVTASVEGALTAVVAKPTTDKGLDERRWIIHGDGKFSLARGGSTLANFTIHATPKGAPTITLIDPPRANVSGSLTLHYSIADAYGAASAEAEFARPGDSGAAAHSLAEPPKLALSLPGSANGLGEARTTSDLVEHPWAGADVLMTLKAIDIAGKVGTSGPIAMKLPQRNFVNPLAKALVEQRRDLILDPDHNVPRVAKSLDALLIAPEQWETPANVYLGLRGAKTMLARASGDKDLIEVADWLWTMALSIEDGDASQAQRDVRAAEQKLREALKNGASDEEIKALTRELREAAERYLNQLAQQDKDADPEDMPMATQDLESMLDRMEEDAKNGARDDAQAMLDQLQDLMENMKSGRDSASDPTRKELRKQLSELDKLMRDQQALRDDTFRRDQRERSNRATPDAQASPDADGDSSLDQRQQSLADRLDEMRKRLKALGLDGEKGFDDAEGAMSEAERDLKGQGQGQGESGGKGKGHTDKGDAVDAQGRALQALREGAQGLQQQMQGQGSGQNGYKAVRGNGRKPGGRDPLGRGDGARGASEGSLHEGPAGAERARRVLQELRRRLADPNRPTDERNYLERLLGRD